MMASQRFDLVLCDIGLPDGSGYDVISKAKAKGPIKAVAITGFGTDEDIRRSKEAGFDFHLIKPVDFQELRTVLEQVGASSLTQSNASDLLPLGTLLSLAPHLALREVF